MPEAGGVFIQSESEISAINMVFGAAVTGVRAMTSSSSPGISLKQEGISYLAACELPAVIANIMRGGPGLGNIAPSQSDYFQAVKGGGHGDYHTIVLAPASVQEMADLTTLAFDLADKYRTPVVILGDGILGQMMAPVEFGTRNPALQGYGAGKRQGTRVEKDWVLDGCKGRKPRVIKSLILAEGELERFNLKLQKKYNEIKNKEQRCEILYGDDSELMLVAYGTPSRIARSVVQKLRKTGKKVGMLRPLTLWPFPEKGLKKIAKKAKAFLVIEMSCGQMIEDVKLSIGCSRPVYFYGRTGGEMPSEKEVISEIRKIYG
jgi:2-oxoglutarate ferredoxin oxidoreductase subunit alpha